MSKVLSPSLPVWTGWEMRGADLWAEQLGGEFGGEAGLGGWAHITGRQGCHWLTPGLWVVMMNMAESLPAVGTALGQAAGALRTPAGERGGAGQGSPVQGPQVGKAPARRRGAGWGWGWKGRTRVPGFSEGAGQLEGAFSIVQ